MELTQENCELIAPKGVFEWFDLIEGTCEGDTTAITFEEKDLPPFPVDPKHQKILARKFSHLTVTDFSLRDRPTRLTFRAGTGNSRVSRSISTEISSLSVQDPSLNTSSPFSDLLKADGRNRSYVGGHHVRLPEDPGQRV